MSRFSERLKRADQRVDRAFAEDVQAVLVIGAEHRPVTVIFEEPDALVTIPGGGEIDDRSPAISAYTRDILGLKNRCQVLIDSVSYWVTHIGANEEGRTRVRLARGEPGRQQPAIDKWSK